MSCLLNAYEGEIVQVSVVVVSGSLETCFSRFEEIVQDAGLYEDRLTHWENNALNGLDNDLFENGTGVTADFIERFSTMSILITRSGGDRWVVTVEIYFPIESDREQFERTARNPYPRESPPE